MDASDLKGFAIELNSQWTLWGPGFVWRWGFLVQFVFVFGKLCFGFVRSFEEFCDFNTICLREVFAFRLGSFFSVSEFFSQLFVSWDSILTSRYFTFLIFFLLCHCPFHINVFFSFVHFCMSVV